MSKKVLVISASPRKEGNSDILCDQFIKGAKETGAEIKKIFVADKKINYCTGCGGCYTADFKDGKCTQYDDDMPEIIQDMIDADVIVMATPVYFYTMDAQLKTLIDRTVPRYMAIENTDFYFLITGAANKKELLERTVNGLRGYLACLPSAKEGGSGKEKGTVYGINSFEKGIVKDTPAYNEAYEMGKSI